MAMAGSARGLGRSRFRGCLLGALLGDCLGGGFEGMETVDPAALLRFVRALQPAGAAAAEEQQQQQQEEEEKEKEPERSDKILWYSDDTAMTHSLVRSLLAKQDFDEVDMAKRFAEEYKRDPERGYGAGVTTVFKKLLSPKCKDVLEPARQQFNGKGSYGNGGAMRVAGISLAYSSVQDVQKFAKLSAELTHANSLGYNGAILQALAVHYALQGELDREKFLQLLIGHMEDVEADDKSVADARLLGYEEFPFSKRLKKIKEFLEQSTVPKSDVVSELGNGIAALHSVPTAIYSFLRCLEPQPDIPEAFNSLQRTIFYCISLGGDTDTIATMAGAVAGAYCGEEQVPPGWKQSCEAFEEAEKLADSLYELYSQRH
ncbi:ADP-ribosylhydrolase ARH3-like isoform X1 [Hemicordylus capensis]|uniref:ADP-ribosylhydrolase ARH3-like isoform X1 n=2 Tax=Hemicordylus capensis TaxID=884348 RepID=UPI002304BAAB|nr:ADP-ribosylhydrolase ARH3-like isoform X1 [Hemicordylus capensis]